MKKNYVLFIILLAFYSANAQNESELNQKKNELKLNLVWPLFGTLEASYERILTNKSSIGVRGTYVYDSKSNEDMNYAISPYYRRYFGKKKASGWFVEGFGMLTSIDGKKIYASEDHSAYTENPDVILCALGGGGGWKWVSKSGFLFEAHVAYGGLLFDVKKTDHTNVQTFGLIAGYRF